MSIFVERREKLRGLFAKRSLPALLVTDELNVTYLTGFSGDASYLLVTADGELLLSDERYAQQLAEECPGLPVEIRGPGLPLVDFAAMTLSAMGLANLGLEADALSASAFERLQSELKTTAVAATKGGVESLRRIKDSTEIATIEAAARVAEGAFREILGEIKPGVSEKAIADTLEYKLRRSGATCGAFPSIVAVGARAALPHGRPLENSKVGDTDFVLIDWGARYRHYHSDLTRMVVTGKLSPQLEEVYGVVLRSQQAGIAAIRPGALLKEVDAAARQVIEAAGYGKQFGHALGHGIGLAVHEQPRVGPGQDQTLVAGMVVTIEPGIYLPGWGGVRIEDDVLVTEDGCRVLSSLPKALEACVL